MKRLITLCLLAACLAGCQSKYLNIKRHADGSIDVQYGKSQVLNADALEAVQITKDGDSYTVEVRGVTSEAQVNGAIAEGVARGLSQGINPAE